MASAFTIHIMFPAFLLLIGAGGADQPHDKAEEIGEGEFRFH
jgi:hypothetical protein